MKNIFWILFLFLTTPQLSGQTATKPLYSFSSQAGFLFFTNNSVDKIREKLLATKRFDTLQNAFVSQGISFSIAYPKIEVENSLLFFNSFSSSSPQNRMIFQIRGIQYQSLYKWNLFNKHHWRSNGHLGLGYTFYTLKAIDKWITNIPFDTLLRYPAATPSLDFTPSKTIFNLNAGWDIEWKTHLFRSFLNDFNIGLRTQYTQPLFARKTVVFNGTNILVSDFPSMSYNHIRLEVLFRVTFKEKEK
jgi:hypothetical protein